MKEIKPIKRSKELIELSRDHHHALLLCWKIRTGISKKVEPSRIANYLKWFFENHLLPHFDFEENHVFVLLDENDPSRKEAERQHQNLKNIIKTSLIDWEGLMEFQQSLMDHVRFEERVLFNEIQEKAGLDELSGIKSAHKANKFCDNDSDPFWK